MIVSDIISRVRPILNDSDASAYRWPDSDLITYISDACRQILIKRPDSNTFVEELTLVAGALQEVPGTAYRLIDIACNKGADGTRGRAITLVEVEVLDSFSPSWRSARRENSVRHYIFDPRTPRRFEVFPPVNAGVKIESKVANYIDRATQLQDPVGLSDEYLEHIVAFVLYKAYARDMEFAGNAELAVSYLTLFNGMLDGKTVADNAFAPAMNRKGDQPSAPAQQIGGV